MDDRSPSPGTHAADAAGSPPAGHRERLSVPWWWWPPVLAVAVLLAAEIHMGYPGVRSWLPYVILLPLSVVVLVRLGRWHVAVDGGGDEPVVRAGAASLPARFAGRTDVVRGPAKQHALGPELDPTALVLHRPWVNAAVRVENLDPDDPAPYWVVSSRRPDRLVEAIGAARFTPRSRGR